MSDENKTLLWVVSEMLSRFAGTFSIANHGYFFELLSFPDAATTSQVLEQHLATSKQDCNWQIRLKPLENDEATLREVLSRWFKDPF